MLNVETATDAEIAEHSSTSSLKLLSSPHNGNTVVQLTHKHVVKYGEYVSEHEYQSQVMARKMVDLNILYVPAVYRYFRIKSIGYIVMEYIDGQLFSQVSQPRRQLLIAAVEHLWSFKGSTAGGLTGGPARGPLWAECGSFSPTSKQSIEQYWRHRLPETHKATFTLEQADLVLCHQDIAERNVLFRTSSAVCILDWEAAGFYPKILEHAALRINSNRESGGNLAQYLLSNLDNHDENHQMTLDLLLKAWGRDLTHWHGPKLTPVLPDWYKKGLPEPVLEHNHPPWFHISSHAPGVRNCP